VIAELVKHAGVVGPADLARIHSRTPDGKVGNSSRKQVSMFYWFMKNLVAGRSSRQSSARG